MQGVASSHNRKPLDEIAPGHETWPRVGAGRRAGCPARALGDQPAAVAVLVRRSTTWSLCRNSRRDLPRTSKWLDVGIASLHIELAARAEGVPGSWVDAPADTTGLELCRYRPERLG